MFQIITAPNSITTPPAISAATRTVEPKPVLKGFQKVFTHVPVLAQYGAGLATTCHGGGPMSLLHALHRLLPYGWTVYTKPGTLLRLDTRYSCHGVQPWSTSLQTALKRMGFHGALYWRSKILTIWAPNPGPWTVRHSSHLNGFHAVVLNASTLSNPALANPKTMNARTKTVPVKATTLTIQSIETQTQSVKQRIRSLHFTPVFTLNSGNLIFSELQKWAKTSGWKVIWQVPEDWQVPNTTTFSGDFQKAVTQVIQALSANGANVHAVFHTANNTVVISGAGGGE
nr:toxin co-regulated pilus biosynthesis Q family protein [Ferrovum sp.]